MEISHSCHQSEHQHCKIATNASKKKKKVVTFCQHAKYLFNFAQPGPPGVWEPLPPPNYVRELRGRLPDVRHQAPVQPPGPVHAHCQGLAGERACHAGSEPALRRHAER